MYTIARRFRYSAAHTLRSGTLSDTENRRVYGKCANPAGHGHDYVLEIMVTGETLTGDVVFGRAALERLGSDHLAPRFAYQDVNQTFGEGFISTGENLAQAVWNLLRLHVPDPLRLTVRLIETEKNAFVCTGEQDRSS